MRNHLRTVLAAALVAAAGTAGALATTAPASAHASLVRITPENDAVLRSAPTTVRLDFDEAVRTPAAVVVTGPSGRVDDQHAEAVDNHVTVRVDVQKTSADVGRYTVAYRVVSADGHPVAGESTFSYRPDGVAAAPVTQATDEEQDRGGVPLGLVLGLVAAVLVAGALLLLPRRLRR